MRKPVRLKTKRLGFIFLGGVFVLALVAWFIFTRTTQESAVCSSDESVTSTTDGTSEPLVAYQAAYEQALANSRIAMGAKAGKPVEQPTFYFGAALAAHQAEGNNTQSDWWAFEQNHGAGKSGAATDEYNRYDEDYALAAELGHNATRFSIEWSKIEPVEGKIDIAVLAHYHQVFASLEKHGLHPIVTLWHFSVPQWFAAKGGFECAKNIKYFTRYIELVGHEYSGEMSDIITINEPNVYAYRGYLIGNFPPGRTGDQQAYTAVSANLVQAHKEAYAVLKKIDPSFRVGTANDNIWFRAARWWNPIDQAIRAYIDYDWNHRFLDHVRDQTDFIGLNYYFCKDVKFDLALSKDYFQYSCPSATKTDIGWEIVPEGLYHVTMDLAGRYHKPIMVTENGLADAGDVHRADFIKDELVWLLKAKQDGATVIGYLHWALTDNFEWDLAFTPRFGLIAIDYNTFARTPRPSAYVYRDLIKKYLPIFNQ
jgi:beta-glucosidase